MPRPWCTTLPWSSTDRRMVNCFSARLSRRRPFTLIDSFTIPLNHSSYFLHLGIFGAKRLIQITLFVLPHICPYIQSKFDKRCCSLEHLFSIYICTGGCPSSRLCCVLYRLLCPSDHLSVMQSVDWFVGWSGGPSVIIS